MANTSMMTLRIDRELVAELKARARKQNRSTSAELVHILRNTLHAGRAKTRSKVQTPSMGMFAQFEAPSTRALTDASKAIRQSMVAAIQASAHALTARGPRSSQQTLTPYRSYRAQLVLLPLAPAPTHSSPLTISSQH